VQLRTLPKTELHLHLDCSLSYAVACELDPALTAEEYRRRFIAPAKCRTLAEFLETAPSGFRLMQSEPALRSVVRDLFGQLAADGVIYAEIRFAPHLHLERGMRVEDVVEVVDDEVARESARSGIAAGVILCTLRHFDRQQSLETARLVERFRGRKVVALDIAGDEAGFPIDAHVDAFRHAIDRGLHRTAHAGEAAGPASVWETLEHFQPSRIGHGVRSMEDPRLIEFLASRRIHLEVCPSSNVQTNAVTSYDAHPIARLVAAGVSTGINTDARTNTNLTLTEEYERLAATFGWTAHDFLARNLDMVEAAFTDEETKRRLRDQLVRGWST
jgi:adenosine deaminase